MIGEYDFVDITFTPEQCDEIVRMAAERHTGNRKGGYNHLPEWNNECKISDKAGAMRVDLMGVMGEAAFCVYMGLQFSYIQTSLHGGDEGYDFVQNGRTIDVKMTTKRGRNLIRPRFKGVDCADYYILCWPQAENGVSLVGAISGRRWLQEKVQMSGGWGDMVRWGGLKTMREFSDHLDIQARM